MSEFKLVEYDDLNIHTTKNGKRIYRDDNSFWGAADHIEGYYILRSPGKNKKINKVTTNDIRNGMQDFVNMKSMGNKILNVTRRI